MDRDALEFLAKLEVGEQPAVSKDVPAIAERHPEADRSTPRRQQQAEMSGKSDGEAAIAWGVLRHAGFMVSLLAAATWVGTFALLVYLGRNYEEPPSEDPFLVFFLLGLTFNAGNAVAQFAVLMFGGLLAAVLALVGMGLSATGLARPPRVLSILGLLLPAVALLLTMLWAAWMESPVPN